MCGLKLRGQIPPAGQKCLANGTEVPDIFLHQTLYGTSYSFGCRQTKHSSDSGSALYEKRPHISSYSREALIRDVPRSEPAPLTRPLRRCWSKRRSPPRSTTTSWRTSTSNLDPARLARPSPRRRNRLPANWPDPPANLHSLSWARR